MPLSTSEILLISIVAASAIAFISTTKIMSQDEERQIQSSTIIIEEVD